MSVGHRMVRCALVALALLSSAVLVASTAWADRWFDVRQYGQFVCHADFDLDDQARLLAGLQELRLDLEEQLGLATTGELVELYLFRDRDRYRDHLKARFPDVSPRRALFVKGRGRGMVFAYRNRELDVDLRHECTHAVLHSSLSDIPLWLDEGLAEYFEVSRNSRVAGHEHLRTIAETLLASAQMTHPTLLERKQELADMTLEDYRIAWAWVHYMLHGPPAAREELIAYLADLNMERPTEPLGRRLERRLPGLPERLFTHLRAWSD